MSLGYTLFGIFLMALVTYLPRMLPLAIFRKKIQNQFVKSFLAYVPYAVLAAMTLPEILYSTNSLLSAAAGMVFALVLAKRGKGLLTVALGASGTVFVVELMMRILVS